MKLSNYFFIWCFCCLFSTTILAQGSYFEITNCNQAKLTIDNTVPLYNDLYAGGNTVDCQQGTQWRANAAGVPAAWHQLQKRRNNQPWENVRIHNTSARVVSFGLLEAGYQYRVISHIAGPTNTKVTTITNPCWDHIGWIAAPTELAIFASNIIEVGEIDVSGVSLIDIFGVPDNAVLCYGDPVFLNASSVYGESAFHIQINSSWNGWGSIGWTQGQTPTSPINLLPVLQSNGGQPGWKFWPGFYTVTLAATQGSCQGWTPITVSFTVVEGTECRRGQFAEDKPEVTIYPNPTANEIRFNNLDYYDFDEAAEYFIHDMTGKLMMQNQLLDASESINVSDLPKGMYIINMVVDGQKITQRFTKIDAA